MIESRAENPNLHGAHSASKSSSGCLDPIHLNNQMPHGRHRAAPTRAVALVVCVVHTGRPERKTWIRPSCAPLTLIRSSAMIAKAKPHYGNESTESLTSA